MISAGEAKQHADAFYSKLDVLKEIEGLIRKHSAGGDYQLNYPMPDIVKAYGSNTLTQDHQRILFELKKAKYDIKLDFENDNLVIIWG